MTRTPRTNWKLSVGVAQVLAERLEAAWGKTLHLSCDQMGDVMKTLLPELHDPSYDPVLREMVTNALRRSAG